MSNCRNAPNPWFARACRWYYVGHRPDARSKYDGARCRRWAQHGMFLRANTAGMSDQADRKPLAPHAPVDESATARVAATGSGNGIPWARVVAGLALIAALVALYAILSKSGALDTLMDGAALRARITELGLLGPFAVVVLMTAAIVLSPIPSAPIALAAGAAYGHVWGTVYVLIGAEAGALIAFAIARLFDFDVVEKFVKKGSSVRFLGSQNTLMAIVFVSRLLPFISFDIVSYAAGLTPLRFWRFAVATLAGIMPASFLLAHFGAEMVSADEWRIAIAALALGAVTGIPIVVQIVRSRRRKRSADRGPH